MAVSPRLSSQPALGAPTCILTAGSWAQTQKERQEEKAFYSSVIMTSVTERMRGAHLLSSIRMSGGYPEPIYPLRQNNRTASCELLYLVGVVSHFLRGEVQECVEGTDFQGRLRVRGPDETAQRFQTTVVVQPMTGPRPQRQRSGQEGSTGLLHNNSNNNKNNKHDRDKTAVVCCWAARWGALVVCATCFSLTDIQ